MDIDSSLTYMALLSMLLIPDHNGFPFMSRISLLLATFLEVVNTVLLCKYIYFLI